MCRKKAILSLGILMGLCLFSCKENKKISENGKDKTEQREKEEITPKPSNVQNGKTLSEAEIISEYTKGLGVLEGEFITRTCDNGRFSIVIENVKSGKPTYKIFDRKKVVAEGKPEIALIKNSEDINVLMGKIGALYNDGKLTVQNYGNSMNEFNNFTQCTDKYLEFSKEGD